MPNPDSLRRAIVRILTPLVRILLRNGISYGTFAQVAKEVFTHVAMNDFAIQGRKQTISRVSVITGLTRKAVKAVMDTRTEESQELSEAYNRAARVIAGWRRDAEFHTDQGQPADLPFGGVIASFSALVKKYSGDMPPRAVLDELSRVGAATALNDGRIRLLMRTYIASNDIQMQLHILGTDAGHLISTIEHNLADDSPQPYLQRKVAYNNLPGEALAPFRLIATERAQALLEQLDEHLSQHDRDCHPEVNGTGRYTAGVGIYYFEEPADHEK